MSAVRERMIGMFDRLRKRGLARQMVGGGLGSAAIKIASMLLGLATVVILARSLGPSGFGVYSYIFALVSVLAIPAQFGLPRLVVRETAKAHVANDWGRMRGVWRWSTRAVFSLSVVVTLAAAAIAWSFAERFTELQLTTFAWGMVLMPLAALARLRGAALEGLRRVVVGQMPESVLRPLLFMVFVSLVIITDIGGTMTAAYAMALHVLAAAIAFAVGAWILYSGRPVPMKGRPRPVYDAHAWLAAAWPLALVSGMQQINSYTDIVLLGVFLSTNEVGMYRVATQGALLVVFGLQTVSMFISPYFARLYVQKDLVALQRLVTVSARLAFFTGVPLGLVFLIWGAQILELIFGRHYLGAYVPMCILVLGQMVNALFGPVGILLSMTGHERDTARGISIGAAANVVLNLVLIPLFGMNGAASATAITLVIWNVLLWRDVRRRININCLAIVPGLR